MAAVVFINSWVFIMFCSRVRRARASATTLGRLNLWGLRERRGIAASVHGVGLVRPVVVLF